VLGTVVLPWLPAFVGCGEEDAAALPSLTVPLSQLPVDTRVRTMLGDVPVELHRVGDEVTARSLLCTHQGCEVIWELDRQRYFCPCHDGSFDAEGRVLGGPPTRPLRSVPVRVENEMVIVGG
jgi:cytochrome b6-f complex iron-sulfur subunit